MYCMSCGGKLKANEEQCKKCGALVEHVAGSNTQGAVRPSLGISREQKYGALIGFSVVAIACSMVAVWAYSSASSQVVGNWRCDSLDIQFEGNGNFRFESIGANKQKHYNYGTYVYNGSKIVASITKSIEGNRESTEKIDVLLTLKNLKRNRFDFDSEARTSDGKTRTGHATCIASTERLLGPPPETAKQETAAVAPPPAKAAPQPSVKPHLVAGTLACENPNSFLTADIIEGVNAAGGQGALPYDCDIVPYDMPILEAHYVSRTSGSDLIEATLVTGALVYVHLNGAVY